MVLVSGFLIELFLTLLFFILHASSSGAWFNPDQLDPRGKLLSFLIYKSPPFPTPTYPCVIYHVWLCGPNNIHPVYWHWYAPHLIAFWPPVVPMQGLTHPQRPY